MKRSFFGKAYFLKLKFAAPTRLALSKYFLSILMMTSLIGGLNIPFQCRLLLGGLNIPFQCRLLLGGLNSPFPKVIKDTVRKYAAVSVSKIIKVRNDKLKSSTHLHGGTVRS